MFHSYLSAILRNLARNSRYFGITLIGLAIGFAAAILVALFVRDELSYDRFLPNHERTFLLYESLHIPGHASVRTPTGQAELASLLALDFPTIEAIARISPDQHTLRHGDIVADEKIYWADPNIFDVLALRASAGDLRSALRQPDGIVLTRRLARKYFGREAPIGEVLEIDGQHPMRIAAVLEDLPTNTHLDTEIIASGRAGFTGLAQLDANPNTAHVPNLVYTYLRLRAGATPEEVQAGLSSFLKRRMPGVESFAHVALDLVPVDKIHLTPVSEQAMRPGGDSTTLYAVSAVGILIILIACINFVNLMTARASRRAVEIGVRKVAGAARADLVIQFVGESILYTAVAMCIAGMLVEFALPLLNGFLGRDIQFDWWRDPILATGLVAGVPVVGGLAGIYPAFVLSHFTPAVVLKSHKLGAGSGRVRQLLVVLQFAILTGLIISTVVVYRQTQFAMNQGMRLDKDGIVIVATTCDGSLKDEIAALPGVSAAACAWSATLSMMPAAHWSVELPDRTEVALDGLSIDFGFLELYGLRPLAGRFFSREHPADSAPREFLNLAPDAARDALTANIVLNESAVRKAGFTSPAAAVGQTLNWLGNRVEIIGVVRDFSVDAIHATIPPSFYIVYPTSFDSLSLKLRGPTIPETLTAIDRIWKQHEGSRPIKRFFLDQHLQLIYLDVTRRATLFTAFGCIAVLIACLGLFGLSSYNAERRTKEIGIRKAMGAVNGEIVLLLVWQLAKPVILANLIAWPVSAVLMRRWLGGFAYHVELELWVFALSSVLALIIALLTVSAHCALVARARPVTTLRYE